MDGDVFIRRWLFSIIFILLPFINYAVGILFMGWAPVNSQFIAWGLGAMYVPMEIAVVLAPTLVPVVGTLYLTLLRRLFTSSVKKML